MASVFRRLAENWKLKALAGALAVLLWVVVSSEQVTSQWISVPLQIQVADPDYQVLPSDIRDVEVRFTGANRDLIDVAIRRPPLRLIIPQIDSETGVYELSPRMLQGATQINVSALDVRPDSVPLHFLRLASRTIPVRVQINDLLGDDWALVGGPVADPAQIQVSGPADRVSALSEISTEIIGLSPADSVFHRVVPLDTSRFEGLNLSARSVEVEARIDRVVERVVRGVPVTVGPGVSIVPDHVDVRLHGPEGTVQEIGPHLFRVVVAIDAIPDQMPADGLAVPLRVDRDWPDVEATVDPSGAQLYPDTAEADGISVPGDAPEAVTSSVGGASGGE